MFGAIEILLLEESARGAYALLIAAQAIALGFTLVAANERGFSKLYGNGIRGRNSLQAVTCTAGGIAAPVLCAGAQSGFAGLDPVNVVLPRSLAGGGLLDIGLSVNGIAANSVQISLRLPVRVSKFAAHYATFDNTPPPRSLPAISPSNPAASPSPLVTRPGRLRPPMPLRTAARTTSP